MHCFVGSTASPTTSRSWIAGPGDLSLLVLDRDGDLALEARVRAARVLGQLRRAVGDHVADLCRDRRGQRRRDLARVRAVDVRRDVDRRVAAAAVIADRTSPTVYSRAASASAAEPVACHPGVASARRVRTRRGRSAGSSWPRSPAAGGAARRDRGVGVPSQITRPTAPPEHHDGGERQEQPVHAAGPSTSPGPVRTRAGEPGRAASPRRRPSARGAPCPVVAEQQRAIVVEPGDRADQRAPSTVARAESPSAIRSCHAGMIASSARSRRSDRPSARRCASSVATNASRSIGAPAACSSVIARLGDVVGQRAVEVDADADDHRLEPGALALRLDEHAGELLARRRARRSAT